MQKVRLKGIKMNSDFRKSEVTNYRTFEKSKSFPGPLNGGETYMFISISRNQVIFFLGIHELEGGQNIIDSRKWRIEGGTWNYHMMEEYANKCGLSIIGAKRIAESIEAEREKRLKRRRNGSS